MRGCKHTAAHVGYTFLWTNCSLVQVSLGQRLLGSETPTVLKKVSQVLVEPDSCLDLGCLVLRDAGTSVTFYACSSIQTEIEMLTIW